MTRLDDAGLAALLAAGRGDGGGDGGQNGTTSADAGLLAAASTLRDALVELDVVVAGTSRLEHRVWVAPDRAVFVLGVQPGLHQVLLLPPSHLAAALVRMTRLRPQRTGDRAPRPWPEQDLGRLVDPDAEVRGIALEEAGATWAWRLGVSWADERVELTAVDGDGGLFLADGDALVPISNTTAYRIFSTALPAEALAATPG